MIVFGGIQQGITAPISTEDLAKEEAIAAILLHQRIHSSIDMNSMGHITTLPKNSNTKLFIYYRRKGTGLRQSYACCYVHGDGSSGPAAPGV